MFGMRVHSFVSNSEYFDPFNSPRSGVGVVVKEISIFSEFVKFPGIFYFPPKTPPPPGGWNVF